MSTWSDERLGRLFERYNRIYWRGQLPRYRVASAKLERPVLGHCDWRKRVIEIDPAKHKSDRHVRRTLLHEMAHAATRKGHGLKFFGEMERLLRRGALAAIETGDAGGGVSIYDDLVPRRFPLLRKRMQRLERRRQKKLDRYVAKKGLTSTYISNEQLASEFGEVDLGAFTWKNALLAVGLQYGLVDDTGRPVSAWARRVVAKGKKVHRSARRWHLEEERLRRKFEAMKEGAT